MSTKKFNATLTPKSKIISDMLAFAYGDITNPKNWPSGNIDTIVNTANPTLMGSRQGVDGAIHKAIDQSLKTSTFNQLICKELKTTYRNKIIRCKRGHAVTTSGGKFCKKVIHVVGSKYDGTEKGKNICSSSCLHTLESCYYSIVEEIKKNPDIEEVGIPIIGAGLYNFPFDLAINVAIASIGNALIDWKTKDEEDFEMVGLKKIYLFIFDENEETMKTNQQIAQDTMDNYKKYFSDNRRVVFQTSFEAHCRYIKELRDYDSQRGYFTIVRKLRLGLLYIRFFFLLSISLKDLFAKKDWAKRRQVVETCVFFKAALPILLWLILQWEPFLNLPSIAPISIYFEAVFSVIIIVCLVDTITYLLVLIILADVQRPSANIIRSLIMLFVNYFELSGDLAFLYYIHYDVRFREALAFGFLGLDAIDPLQTLIDYSFVASNTGLKFFLVTLVFGYFFNHMHQRKFRN